MRERSLHCTLGQTGCLGDRAGARYDWFPSVARRLRIQVQIYEISRGLLIVADQIAH
jgi:hypothetical protein